MKNEILDKYLEKFRGIDPHDKVDQMVDEIVPLLSKVNKNLGQVVMYLKLHAEHNVPNNRMDDKSSKETRMIIDKILAKITDLDNADD